MGLIGALVSFSPSTVISSSDTNQNNSDIRTAFNNTAVLTDTARTITVTDIWTASQTFSGGFTVASGQAITVSGVTITGLSKLGLGQAAATDRLIAISGAAGGTTGTSQYGIVLGNGAVFNSTATSDINGIRVGFQTENASFTTTTVRGIHILTPLKGASHTITTLIGLNVEPLSAGTINHGISLGHGTGGGNALVISQNLAITDDALVIKSGSQTGSTAVNIIDLSQTWNTSGNPTAILLDITKTATGGAAKFLDLQAGSSSRFSVDEFGAVKAGVGTATSTFRVSQTLHQAVSLATSASVLTALSTFSLPASALAADGQAIRLTMFGFATTSSCQFTIGLGGGNLIAVTVATSATFSWIAIITRNAAATQLIFSWLTSNTTFTPYRTTSAMTLADANDIKFMALSAAGAGSAVIDYAMVEYLSD